MSDKPTGEWTAKFVNDVATGAGMLGQEWAQVIADYHNAALVAERDKWIKINRQHEDAWSKELLKTVDEAKRQLDAEKKRYDELENLHRLMLVESNRQDEKVQTLVDALNEISELDDRSYGFRQIAEAALAKVKEDK